MIFDRYFDNSHESYISRVQTFASATEQAISRVLTFANAKKIREIAKVYTRES